jgi:ABC-2 type transport system permease protein
VHALVPRAAGAAVYGLIAWSFLIEFIGSVIKMNHWLLDTSVLFHVAPAPATTPHWLSAGVLVALGVIAAGVGAGIFSRRDLISA